LPFYKTSYLNKEVNCIEPFPSVSVPWLNGFAVDRGEKVGAVTLVRLERYQKGFVILVGMGGGSLVEKGQFYVEN
jgi:hypothetical protein